jgi:S-DNA-T family DNA segregation ATPase FtsK/SpoIIIE
VKEASGTKTATAAQTSASVPEESGPQSRIARELIALAFAGLAAFATLSLASEILGYSPSLCGPLGEAVAGGLVAAFGYESILVIVLAFGLAREVWRASGLSRLGHQLPGATIVILALSAGAGLLEGIGPQAGGVVGYGIAQVMLAYLNIGGGYLAVSLALIGGLALMLKRAPTELLHDLFSSMPGSIRSRSDESANPNEFVLAEDAEFDFAGNSGMTAMRSNGAANDNGAKEAPRKIEFKRPITLEKSARLKPQPKSRNGYKLPTVVLLDSPPALHTQVDEALLERSARTLEQKLADFGVDGRVVEVQPGPVVTMYKFEPGSGIKVSQIVNLADDLSMALRAATVRIQAPVPGEAVVGIEVPNRKRELVYLREILEAEEFQSTQSHLTIALGKDIAGRPMAADLARMPHLLIAGATGTGKSVSIHTMLASILFNATADDVRFILIDPKMLELSVYEHIPHLLVPVVVDPGKAAAALLWATQEMENRYRMMRDLGVRNIDGYNKLLSSKERVVELRPNQSVDDGDESASDEAKPSEHHRLPKIVIVIDELADLLLSEGKTVERDITRLAQKARAAGIHLILATQRPSVDVITGLIKANLPARISFQVTSRVDSRTILDSVGAERLLGAGDMLFMPPGSAKLVRLHGPFVSEAEIRKVTDFLRAQGVPDYRMEILETKAPGDEAGDDLDGARDELYDEAVRIVMETGQASISGIQRRLRIGYNRAARMVEQMEREGLVAPADGARPREVRGLR